MTYSEIRYEVDVDVGILTLNRPEARNALTYTTYAELEDAVRTTNARCLVITGEDPAFCSGDDVKQIMVQAGQRASAGGAPAYPCGGRPSQHRRSCHRRGQRRRGRLGYGGGGDG